MNKKTNLPPMTNNKNLYPQLDKIHHAFRQQLMAHAEKKGHKKLKLHYNQIFSCIGEDGIRISDLAKAMGVSKQSISRLILEVEDSGYLVRTSDKDDKRATKINLSPKGHQLIEDTKSITLSIEKQYAKIVGPAEFTQLKKSLSTIHQHYCPGFHLKSPNYKKLNNSLLVYLEAIKQYIQKRLMNECINAGFDNLKLSYNMILPYIAEDNKSISELREIHDVSKQAIGQVANTLEKHGYLNSATDKKDKRVKVLTLTKKGQSLIKTAFTTLATIENEISLLIGHCEAVSLIDNLKKINSHTSKLFITQQDLLQWITSIVNQKKTNPEHQNTIEATLGKNQTKVLEASLKKIKIYDN